MSKTISVSDEVYERLSRENGDRNFSEVIADAPEEGTRIEDVSGRQIFDADTDDAVNEETRRLSVHTRPNGRRNSVIRPSSRTPDRAR